MFTIFAIWMMVGNQINQDGDIPTDFSDDVCEMQINAICGTERVDMYRIIMKYGVIEEKIK